MKRFVAELRRVCAICGRPLIIRLYSDGSYEGGHYFGKPDGANEYWECEDCYRAWFDPDTEDNIGWGE